MLMKVTQGVRKKQKLLKAAVFLSTERNFDSFSTLKYIKGSNVKQLLRTKKLV